MRDHLAYPEIAVDILQRYVVACQGHHASTTQAIVCARGFVPGNHQRAAVGDLADAAGGAGQVDVAADDGHRITGDARDIPRRQHIDVAIAVLATASIEAQLRVGMDIERDHTTLGGGLQRATTGQGSIDGLAP